MTQRIEMTGSHSPLGELTVAPDELAQEMARRHILRRYEDSRETAAGTRELLDILGLLPR